MAIPQPVSLFEALEQQRPTTPPPNTHKQHNVSSRIRLQLQTMFHHNHHGHPSKFSSTAKSSTNTTPSSSAHNSPAQSYRSYSPRSLPHSPSASSDILSLFTPLSATSTSAGMNRRHLRRQPSAIDLVLEAERHAVGHENVGLGLLEPRPRAPSVGSASASSECSMMEFMSEHQSQIIGGAVVLDGIFEVMEGR